MFRVLFIQVIIEMSWGKGGLKWLHPVLQRWPPYTGLQYGCYTQVSLSTFRGILGWEVASLYRVCNNMDVIHRSHCLLLVGWLFYSGGLLIQVCNRAVIHRGGLLIQVQVHYRIVRRGDCFTEVACLYRIVHMVSLVDCFTEVACLCR